MIDREQADEKIRTGWLRIWAGFDALAAAEETVKAALAELIGKLDEDSRAKVYKKEFSDVQKVENPLKGIKEGFSQTVKTEFLVKNLDDLVDIVIEYGPSAIEILEPPEFKLKAVEAQAIINSIAALMHRYAAAGLGGAVFVMGKGEEK